MSEKNHRPCRTDRERTPGRPGRRNTRGDLPLDPRSGIRVARPQCVTSTPRLPPQIWRSPTTPFGSHVRTRTDDTLPHFRRAVNRGAPRTRDPAGTSRAAPHVTHDASGIRHRTRHAPACRTRDTGGAGAPPVALRTNAAPPPSPAPRSSSPPPSARTHGPSRRAHTGRSQRRRAAQPDTIGCSLRYTRVHDSAFAQRSCSRMHARRSRPHPTERPMAAAGNRAGQAAFQVRVAPDPSALPCTLSLSRCACTWLRATGTRPSGMPG